MADARLLATAADITGDTLTVHSPPDDLSAVHIICGAWHYVVMPRTTDETKDVAKQLCLRGMGSAAEAVVEHLEKLRGLGASVDVTLGPDRSEHVP